MKVEPVIMPKCFTALFYYIPLCVMVSWHATKTIFDLMEVFVELDKKKSNYDQEQFECKEPHETVVVSKLNLTF